MYCACFRGVVGATVLKRDRKPDKLCFSIKSLSEQKLFSLLMPKNRFSVIQGFNAETVSIHLVFVVIVVEFRSFVFCKGNNFNCNCQTEFN